MVHVVPAKRCWKACSAVAEPTWRWIARLAKCYRRALRTAARGHVASNHRPAPALPRGRLPSSRSLALRSMRRRLRYTCTTTRLPVRYSDVTACVLLTTWSGGVSECITLLGDSIAETDAWYGNLQPTWHACFMLRFRVERFSQHAEAAERERCETYVAAMLLRVAGTLADCISCPRGHVCRRASIRYDRTVKRLRTS